MARVELVWKRNLQSMSITTAMSVLSPLMCRDGLDEQSYFISGRCGSCLDLPPFGSPHVGFDPLSLALGSADRYSCQAGGVNFHPVMYILRALRCWEAGLLIRVTCLPAYSSR